MVSDKVAGFLAAGSRFEGRTHVFEVGDDLAVLPYVRIILVGFISPIGSCHVVQRLAVLGLPDRASRPLRPSEKWRDAVIGGNVGGERDGGTSSDCGDEIGLSFDNGGRLSTARPIRGSEGFHSKAFVKGILNQRISRSTGWHTRDPQDDDKDGLSLGNGGQLSTTQPIRGSEDRGGGIHAKASVKGILNQRISRSSGRHTRDSQDEDKNVDDRSSGRA
jgi:hypothetical protein